MGGRTPTPIYIDGHYFPSMAAARTEMNALRGEPYAKFTHALRSGMPFNGHTISYFPTHKEATQEATHRERGAALLRGHETHRIGVYTDSRW